MTIRFNRPPDDDDATTNDTQEHGLHLLNATNGRYINVADEQMHRPRTTRIRQQIRARTDNSSYATFYCRLSVKDRYICSRGLHLAWTYFFLLPDGCFNDMRVYTYRYSALLLHQRIFRVAARAFNANTVNILLLYRYKCLCVCLCASDSW